ncbi:uncharacterized protein LOC126891915 isoform X3 [Diabrotica virgifera virgifera]|uniref:Uncharacterized protein LOC114343462 isoform X2 n=1 Tax=Diabrotica virgifera virgifera TaxID=50390 RepID=A0A6P7GXF0_DIAVI|nr:uncharacterized protein LOC126891915 isoform X3 [Diabrotica virgifera virgifera]
MEVKQESIINFPKEECEIKVENIDVHDVEVSYSVKTEVKDELLESCSPNNDTHSNFDDANSIDSQTKAFYIEDIKLEEEDKPDIIPIENGRQHAESAKLP